MKCLLCSHHFIRESLLKNHYAAYHFINEEGIFFRNLFTSDTIDKTCRFCNVILKSCQNKKKHMFLYHYGKHQQMGGNKGARTWTSGLPISVLKREPMTYYSINFNQHKNFYNFLSSNVVDIFLNSAYKLYHTTKENKIQGYAEVINQQRGEIR